MPPSGTKNELDAKLAILDDHATEARLECYRHFGAELPADGGRPTPLPKIGAARAKQKRQEPKPVRFCPEHPGIQLPTNGVCDDCA